MDNRSKLNEQQVRLIRQFLQRHPPVQGHIRGGQCSFLSRWFGVSQPSISDIHIGRTWKQVNIEGAK